MQGLETFIRGLSKGLEAPNFFQPVSGPFSFPYQEAIKIRREKEGVLLDFGQDDHSASLGLLFLG